MTSSTSHLARRGGLLLLAAALPVLSAAPAHAEVPEGWSDPEDVGILQLLLVVLGLPAALFVIILLAIVLPPLARGEKVLSSGHTPDQWFGGPGRPAGELESRGTRELGPTGGASGTW